MSSELINSTPKTKLSAAETEALLRCVVRDWRAGKKYGLCVKQKDNGGVDAIPELFDQIYFDDIQDGRTHPLYLLYSIQNKEIEGGLDSYSDRVLIPVGFHEWLFASPKSRFIDIPNTCEKLTVLDFDIYDSFLEVNYAITNPTSELIFASFPRDSRAFRSLFFQYNEERISKTIDKLTLNESVVSIRYRNDVKREVKRQMSWRFDFLGDDNELEEFVMEKINEKIEQLAPVNTNNVSFSASSSYKRAGEKRKSGQ